MLLKARPSCLRYIIMDTNMYSVIFHNVCKKKLPVPAFKVNLKIYLHKYIFGFIITFISFLDHFSFIGFTGPVIITYICISMFD